VRWYPGRENRFDAGEVILEIALIVCSLTLLTKRKTFWYSGIAIGSSDSSSGPQRLLVH